MNWLKEKKINLISVAASLLIIIFAYIINTNFHDSLVRKLSESLFWLVVPILFFSIITLFTKRKVFFSWAKLTICLFIIFSIIILLTPTSTHGLDFFPIIKETVTIFLAILYSIISLIIIIYKSLKKD